MTPKLFLIAATLIAVLASGCALVSLTPEGEQIRILDPAEVSSCRKLGTTAAATTAAALGHDRPIETITNELRITAQNGAAKMGGDTIVALTIIENGKQTYEVYRCIEAAA